MHYLKHGLSDNYARLIEIAQFDETTIGRFALFANGSAI